MVQLSQTSWQEFTLANVKESLTYAPMNMAIDSNPILYYTLPKELVSGEKIKYTLVIGFKIISWTGIVSAINEEGKLMVRLDEGPFRGFTATHLFETEGSLTACHDEFTFQGITEIPEKSFESLMQKAHIVYAIESRKDAREIILAHEAKKQTQTFESLESSATAG